jgi:hypothetical protein
MSSNFDRFPERIEQVTKLVQRTNKSSVLVIQQFPVPSDANTTVANVRESISNIIAFVELGDAETLKEAIKVSDGTFDNIILDSDIKLTESRKIVSAAIDSVKHSKLFFYSDYLTWAETALHFLWSIEGSLNGRKMFLCGSGILADMMKTNLQLLGSDLLNPADAIHKADIIVGVSVKKPSCDEDVSTVKDGINVYDLGIGNFTAAQIDVLSKKGCTVYRLDNRAGISSMVLQVLETEYLTKKMMGRTEIRGISIVAGGLMGKNGAIVVDDINHPSHVIGIANGFGFIKVGPENEQEKNNLEFVQELIAGENS